ncbi:MAG TPA: T9SS type A sorting domain-containing protein [Candidatus Eisenbacteria bacterium]|nr:T9SS type A sorting domain-containing protein [Candidatus Eisenbacteria bacterium]
MPRTLIPHLRLRPCVLPVLAVVAVSLALLIPRGAPAGPIEDRLREALERLDTRDLRTGVLYDRVLPLSGIERFAGDGRAVASRDLWRQLYEELRRASADPGQRPPAEMLIERARRRQDAVPLAVVLDRYERIRPDAMERGAVEVRDGRLVRGRGEAFEARTAFAAAALREWTYRGAEVNFELDRADFFSNRDVVAPRLEADLDDGLGFRAMGFDRPLTARYAETGTKTLRLRATTSDGATVEAAFAFSVRALAAPTPNDTIQVTGTIPYLGGVASGEAYVYLAPGRAQIQNPAVVVEGFDLDNDMNWDELYALLNGENLLESLRADGYDAVVLNFTDATDYLQRNAFVVVDLLQQVQGVAGPRTVALAGASMGGLVSRYALAYMETNGLPHAVRTFISFDAPHMGANIPLGIQYWVRFFSGQSSDAAVFLGLLDRPAARQMLVYHYTDPAGATGQPDPLRGTFEADLAAVGDWPVQPRLVAIANGSDNGTGEPFAPGAQIVQWSYSDLFVAITGNIWAVPNVTSTKIFDGRLRILFSTTTQAVTVNGTQPYDNAPGGWRASMAQLDSVAAPYGDIVALYDNHCFIPTVSALAYGAPDLLHDIAADPDPVSNTPFDAIYSQGTNQEHVAITPENAAWIRNEIEMGVTGVQGPIAGAEVRLRTPWPNPSSGRVRIGFSLARPEVVDLRVFSVDGRQVADLARGVWGAGNHQVTWSGRDSRGALTASGVYFVRFATQDGVRTRRMVRFR